MKKILVVVFFLMFGFYLNAQKLISIDSTSNYEGQFVIVCEKVAEAFKPSGDNKLTYLNFGGKYPNNTFTVVIYPKDLPNFPFNPVEKYNDKKICVKGKISFFKDKPQIIAKNPDQIELIIGE